MKLAVGSHNARSIACALAELEKRGLPRTAIEIQMLHGMADQLKHAAVEMGLRVREYVPVGEMIPGMAYLVRRLLENTSNESWLLAGFMANADPRTLLENPRTLNNHPRRPIKRDLVEDAPARHTLSPAIEGLADSRPFFNEPTRDFSQRRRREAFADAIASARGGGFDGQFLLSYVNQPSNLASELGGGLEAESIIAGFEWLDGLLTTAYLLSAVEDEDNTAVVEHVRIMEAYGGPPSSNLSIYGQSLAETVVETLERPFRPEGSSNGFTS